MMILKEVLRKMNTFENSVRSLISIQNTDK